MSFSPRHLKFWIESYLNKPNAKLQFQFKDVKLSLSQWGVFPVIGLKSSFVEVRVKKVKSSCFAASTINLNTVFIKISPLDLLFGKLHFNSLKVKSVDFGLNSFCENLSINKMSQNLSYFMQNKAQREIDSFINWFDQIEVDDFLVSNQVTKIIKIKNLKLVSYKKPKFLSLSGDIFPYLQGSFKLIKAIKPKIRIYPHTIKANWWWHLHEGIVNLKTSFDFSKTGIKKLKYATQLNLKGDISYFPISSVLDLFKKMQFINIQFPELSMWLSCQVEASFNLSKLSSDLLPKGFSVKKCKLQGLDLRADLEGSSWKLKPLRVEKNTTLYFSNLSVEKILSPLFSDWVKKSEYFRPIQPTFMEGMVFGKLLILKNKVWQIDASVKGSVLNFFNKKKLEWFAVPDLDFKVKTTSDFSKISVLLNNILLPESSTEKTQISFVYNRASTSQSDLYSLVGLKFKEEDLKKFKDFPFLKYLKQKQKELK